MNPKSWTQQGSAPLSHQSPTSSPACGREWVPGQGMRASLWDVTPVTSVWGKESPLSHPMEGRGQVLRYQVSLDATPA
jgi:hypothetical protein